MRASLKLLAFLAVVAAPAAEAYTFKTIHTFCTEQFCPGGAVPRGGMIRDAAGNLYGTTYAGGRKNLGTVYRLSPNGDGTYGHSVLHSFCRHDCKDGNNPNGKLVIDTAGNLYGTTSAGGAHRQGIIYRLSPPKAGHTRWTLHTLYAFCAIGGDKCLDGAGPVTGLTYQGAESGAPYDNHDPLYGVTQFGGGAQWKGVAYRLTHGGGTWTYDVIYSSCEIAHCADGARPQGATLDASGNILIAQQRLGAGGGTVLELSPDGLGGWTPSVLHAFDKHDKPSGFYPNSPLVLDGSGNIYGTTSKGGNSSKAGTAYELSPGGSLTVLHDFCGDADCADGNTARDITRDGSGNLFGTTGAGGQFSNAGMVFELSGGTYDVLHDFCAETRCADGKQPYGELLVDGAGNIFGVTEHGGNGDSSGGQGVVFELVP